MVCFTNLSISPNLFTFDNIDMAGDDIDRSALLKTKRFREICRCAVSMAPVF